MKNANVKRYIIATTLMLSLISNGCRNTAEKSEIKTIRDSASFIVRFDKTMGDKDGFYLNGYVVPVPFNMIDSLDGKLIKVSGLVLIHKGVEEEMKENGVEVQGRVGITKYITNPIIKIVSSESKAK